MAAEAQGTRTTVADPLKPTGFWSYTSSDDKHSDGHLSQLRRPGLAHGHRPRLRDLGDELVLEAAVNGHAAFIAPFNRRDFGTVPLQFGTGVLTPSEAVRRIRT